MTDLKHLLFSFRGRIGRQSWWLASLAVAFISGTANGLIEVAAKTSGHGTIDPMTQEFVPSGPYIAALLVLAVFSVWINYALAFKRLHDRDRSGWWVVVPMIVIGVGIAMMLWASAMPEGQSTPLFYAGVVIALVAIAMGLWLLVELGFLKGTEGPNRFGPDPLSPKSANDRTLTSAGS